MKNNKEVQVKENKFFSFPEKINSIAIFLIVLLYTFVCVTITILLVSPKSYVVIPESNHNTAYNYEANIYTKVANNISVSEHSSDEHDHEKHTHVDQKFSVYAYVKAPKVPSSTTSSLITTTIPNLEVKISALTNSGKMKYFSDEKVTNVSSTTLYSQTSTTVDGNGYEELFVKYTLGSDNASLSQGTTYSYSEPMIKLSKREILSDNYTNQTSYGNYFHFKVAAVLNTESKNYNITTNLYIDVPNNDKTTPHTEYHLDYQSFVVTEDDEIYDLVGFYNIATNNDTITSHSNTVSSKINIKYIIVKAYMYVDGKVVEALYRANIKDLQ